MYSIVFSRTGEIQLQEAALYFESLQKGLGHKFLTY